MYRTELTEVKELYGQFPTVGGVVKLLRLLKLDELVAKYYGKEASEDDTDLIVTVEIFNDIFSSKIFTQMRYDGTDLFPDIPELWLGRDTVRNCKRTNDFGAIFREQRTAFLNRQPIHFMFPDGQH